jgi:hypothetical protein
MINDNNFSEMNYDLLCLVADLTRYNAGSTSCDILRMCFVCRNWSRLFAVVREEAYLELADMIRDYFDADDECFPTSKPIGPPSLSLFDPAYFLTLFAGSYVVLTKGFGESRRCVAWIFLPVPHSRIGSIF